MLCIVVFRLADICRRESGHTRVCVQRIHQPTVAKVIERSIFWFQMIVYGLLRVLERRERRTDLWSGRALNGVDAAAAHTIW